MTYRRMRSRYAGICGECKASYEIGDNIWYERSNYCMCDDCGYRYAANADKQHAIKQQQQLAATSTPTPSSPPPESREQAIERMHGENVNAAIQISTALATTNAKLQMIAEQIGLLADKEQKRNEYLEAEAKKGKGSQ